MITLYESMFEDSVEICAAGFPSASKPSVCWDPLQTFRVQGELNETIINYRAHRLRAAHSAASAASSHSVPNPDTDFITTPLQLDMTALID
jgi:hypothetical protein